MCVCVCVCICVGMAVKEGKELCGDFKPLLLASHSRRGARNVRSRD